MRQGPPFRSVALGRRGNNWYPRARVPPQPFHQRCKNVLHHWITHWLALSKKVFQGCCWHNGSGILPTWGAQKLCDHVQLQQRCCRFKEDSSSQQLCKNASYRPHVYLNTIVVAPGQKFRSSVVLRDNLKEEGKESRVKCILERCTLSTWEWSSTLWSDMGCQGRFMNGRPSHACGCTVD